MLLTIDVGNTQVALGMFDREELVGHWRISTNAEATFDEARWQLVGILGADGFTQSDVRGVAISSVVPAMTSALRRVAPHLSSGPRRRCRAGGEDRHVDRYRQPA